MWFRLPVTCACCSRQAWTGNHIDKRYWS